MKRPLRLLRWAVSTAAFIACLLIATLWVRSYYSLDWVVLEWPGPSRLIVDSGHGSTKLQWSATYRGRLGLRRSSFSTFAVVDLMPVLPPESAESIGWTLPEWTRPLRSVSFSHEHVRLPDWTLMLAAAVIGAAPWLRWRFSVRGVLVLMAFIAAMFAVLIFE
jgi:hypothetical protein